MNIAIIFAGGTGQRMNSKTRPKQFLELHNKPIIIYTLEQFEMHKDIHGIIVVCLEPWINYCKQLVDKYRISKVQNIVAGGECGQASIYNGLCAAAKIYPQDSIVLIHDGVRPLIDADTITENINCVIKHGSAITVSPATETVTLFKNENQIMDILDRKKCLIAKAPQCFYLNELLGAHRKALNDKLNDFIDSGSLMKFYGHSLYTVLGKVENIKITTPSDFYIFRAILDARENSQIFG